MEYKIKHYSSSCELEFGKYTGWSVWAIAEKDPQYIEWCIINLSHFYLNPRHDNLLAERLNLSVEAKNIIFAKSKLYEKQLAEEHNLTCRDGYGEHEYEEDYLYGEVCIICGYDKERPEPDDYNEDGYATSSYEDDSDEVDRWNFDALSGGQFGDYDSFKENGGDVDDLREHLGY